ncbi:MAG TPA: MarR family winged helix-turn-helix transcriptional regulator [Propionibacteriaceae bacterium]|nr:MarR family winged helix-turn-helix transcriptional regulator [Propionibacteriaceae bacterium]
MSIPNERSRDSDLIESSRWRPLRLLLSAMDRDIAAFYDNAGIHGFRPRFSPALIQLARQGPMTIRALADAVDVTHSAMSQTVAAMRSAGLVSGAPTIDARTRAVRLTPKARRLVPFLEAEWRATERTVIELEEEIPYPLTQVVRDIEHAVGRRSFGDRLEQHLAEYLDEGSE